MNSITSLFGDISDDSSEEEYTEKRPTENPIIPSSVGKDVTNGFSSLSLDKVVTSETENHLAGSATTTHIEYNSVAEPLFNSARHGVEPVTKSMAEAANAAAIAKRNAGTGGSSTNGLPSKAPGLFLIGLGLGDEKDITVRGLEAVKSCDFVFLEAYTSVLGVDVQRLSDFYGCSNKLFVADRTMVESEADNILTKAKDARVAFLVVGDPFGATTHTDLFLRAKELGINVDVIHNASIMNAVGCCGLQLYRYGYCVSLPFFRAGWQPDSFYKRIKHNRSAGLHTLCLLDIKVKEPDFETLISTGKETFLPPRYMTCGQAVSQMLEVEEKRGEGVYGPKTLCVGLARVGRYNQKIVVASMEDMVNVDMGGPLHSLVIVGQPDEVEESMLKLYS